MTSTSVPVSHMGVLVYDNNMMTVYGGSSPSSCFLGIGGSGCAIDTSKWQDWVGVKGTGETLGNLGESIRQSSIGIKDFAISGDKIAKMLPFIVILLAFGLAIGWSKGRRYFI